MYNTTDKRTSVDLRGLNDASKPERVLLLEPKEYRGPEARKIVARTSVEITFDDEEKLQACVEGIRRSDEELSRRPDSRELWGWRRTYRDGMTILFGVNWYDIKFFEERKDAYRSARQAAVYQRFGATADQFNVVHEVFQRAQ